MFRAWLVGLVLLIGVAAPLVAADVTIIDNGQSKAAVFVPERLWDDAAKNPEPASVWRSLKPAASCTTASGLPRIGTAVNTSSWEKRRSVMCGAPGSG